MAALRPPPHAGSAQTPMRWRNDRPHGGPEPAGGAQHCPPVRPRRWRCTEPVSCQHSSPDSVCRCGRSSSQTPGSLRYTGDAAWIFQSVCMFRQHHRKTTGVEKSSELTDPITTVRALDGTRDCRIQGQDSKPR